MVTVPMTMEQRLLYEMILYIAPKVDELTFDQVEILEYDGRRFLALQIAAGSTPATDPVWMFFHPQAADEADMAALCALKGLPKHTGVF